MVATTWSCYTEICVLMRCVKRLHWICKLKLQSVHLISNIPLTVFSKTFGPAYELVGTYCNLVQQGLRGVCANAQTHPSICCMHAKSLDVDVWWRLRPKFRPLSLLDTSHATGFIQACLSKIQGHFKDF